MLDINPEIVQSCTKCLKNHRCLEQEDECLGQITQTIGDIIFTKCSFDINCNHQIPYGYSKICVCPIRKEIYKKFKL